MFHIHEKWPFLLPQFLLRIRILLHRVTSNVYVGAPSLHWDPLALCWDWEGRGLEGKKYMNAHLHTDMYHTDLVSCIYHLNAWGWWWDIVITWWCIKCFSIFNLFSPSAWLHIASLQPSWHRSIRSNCLAIWHTRHPDLWFTSSAVEEVNSSVTNYVMLAKCSVVLCIAFSRISTSYWETPVCQVIDPLYMFRACHDGGRFKILVGRFIDASYTGCTYSRGSTVFESIKWARFEREVQGKRGDHPTPHTVVGSTPRKGQGSR